MSSPSSQKSRPREWVLYSLVFICVPSARAQAPSPSTKPSSCEEVSARILAPYRESLKKVEAAMKEYETLNGENTKKIQDRIALLESCSEVFSAARTEQENKHRNHIRLSEEALKEATTEAQSRIAAAQKEAADWRARNRPDRVRSAEDYAAAIQKKVTDGTYEYYKKGLGYANTIKGWHRSIKERSEALENVKAEFAAGTYGVFLKKLGHGATWNQVLQAIADARAELDRAQKGALPYALHTLGYAQTRDHLKEQLKNAELKLMTVEELITSGRYDVFVPALGYHANRNTVQRMISEALEKKHRIESALRSGRYRNPRSKAGSRTRAEVQHERDMLLTNAGVSRRLERRDEADSYERDWNKKGEELDDLNRLAEEEKAAQDKEIGGRLTEALNQTPCGGGENGPRDPRRALVEKHLHRINALSETVENEKDKNKERKRRANDYLDYIYMEQDGTVHGDEKVAWRQAMEVPPTRPAEEPGLIAGARAAAGLEPKGLSGTLQDLKDLADWLSGFKDLAEVSKAQLVIMAFIKDVESLDPGRMSAQQFAAVRTQIAGRMSELDELLTKGVFSRANIDRFEKAILKVVPSGRQAEESLARLARVREVVDHTHHMIDSGSAMGRAVATLGREWKVGARAFLDGSARQLSERLKTSYSQMSGLDKGLMVLSASAAAAEAYDLVEAGQPVSEAVARSSVNFTIDLMVANVPILAASELACQVVFGTCRYATNDPGYTDAVPSNTIKYVARQAFDQVVAGADRAGECEVALERFVSGAKNDREIMANVNTVSLQQALVRTEAQIAALSPGSLREARLMHIRAGLRRILRAKNENVVVQK